MFAKRRREAFGQHEASQTLFQRFAAQDRVKRALFWQKGNALGLAKRQVGFIRLAPAVDTGQADIEGTDATALHRSAAELVDKQHMLHEMQDRAMRGRAAWSEGRFGKQTASRFRLAVHQGKVTVQRHDGGVRAGGNATPVNLLRKPLADYLSYRLAIPGGDSLWMDRLASKPLGSRQTILNARKPARRLNTGPWCQTLTRRSAMVLAMV